MAESLTIKDPRSKIKKSEIPVIVHNGVEYPIVQFNPNIDRTDYYEIDHSSLLPHCNDHVIVVGKVEKYNARGERAYKVPVKSYTDRRESNIPLALGSKILLIITEDQFNKHKLQGVMKIGNDFNVVGVPDMNGEILYVKRLSHATMKYPLEINKKLRLL